MTVANDAAHELEEVPSALPHGRTCSGTDTCELSRRSRQLPADLSEHITASVADFVVAALLVLARKYCDSLAFRLAIRRQGSMVDITSQMPAELDLAQHRRAVSADRERTTQARETATGVGLCYAVDDAFAGSTVDLTVAHEVTPNGVTVHADFHEHVHSAEFVERLLGHLEKLLRQSVDHPMTTIGDAHLLSDSERAQWASLNDTCGPYPHDAVVFDLFTAQATARPDRVAIRHDEGSLTYGQLLSLALGMAAKLHAHGVGRHSRVALYLRKSPLLIAAVLAVLRLGAAYVPIDPDVPKARRNFLLDDSGAALLLVDDPSISARVPALDVTATQAPAADTVLPDVAVSPDDAAYVMYTSGTTGRPKGVVVAHRAVVRLVRGTDYAEFTPETRILQTGSVAFDATTFEFWGALLNGGSIVLVPGDTVLNATDLGAAIARHQVNTIFLTTGLFNQLVDQQAAALDGCQVLFGGEAASARHVDAAVRACPRSRFVHVYGPTENTTFSVAHRITRAYSERVPIGRPIANSTAWVLGRDGHPQPVGVPGQLHVGGAGLATGYLNHPELDEASFTDAAGPFGRLYRTGDIALLNADAQLEFVGRADGQVKVRGYRVELAEIEHHLARAPGVHAAVVLSRRDAGGMTSLCGFFTASTRLDPPGVHAELRRELPDYLVPSFLLQVDAMPLTVNQKIDKAALAAMWPSGARPSDARVPLSAMEADVAKIFSDVLAVRISTADADFFDLGGDSLRMMRLRNRIRTELGVEIGLSQIYDAPTVGGMASILEQAETTTGIPVSVSRRM
jgi:amino acid adenylation domain-containing protein